MLSDNYNIYHMKKAQSLKMNAEGDWVQGPAQFIVEVYDCTSQMELVHDVTLEADDADLSIYNFWFTNGVSLLGFSQATNELISFSLVDGMQDRECLSDFFSSAAHVPVSFDANTMTLFSVDSDAE